VILGNSLKFEQILKELHEIRYALDTGRNEAANVAAGRLSAECPDLKSVCYGIALAIDDEKIESALEFVAEGIERTEQRMQTARSPI
jgi:hypothetical protein